MIKAAIKTTSLFFILIVFLSCASKASPASYEPDFTSYGGSLEALQRDRDEKPEIRMIAYTVYLSLSVKNAEITKAALIEQIKNHDGFIVKESEEYITSRIPVEKMDAYVKIARTLGKIENESKTGTDITDQYRDNVIRLDNLKNVRMRYLTLLEKAVTVSEILSIEKELERVNTEIELLEGKIKYAEQSVAYSSVTVRFLERKRPGPLGWIFYGTYYAIKWLFVWK